MTDKLCTEDVCRLIPKIVRLVGSTDQDLTVETLLRARHEVLKAGVMHFPGEGAYVLTREQITQMEAAAAACVEKEEVKFFVPLPMDDGSIGRFASHPVFLMDNDDQSCGVYLVTSDGTEASSCKIISAV